MMTIMAQPLVDVASKASTSLIEYGVVGSVLVVVMAVCVWSVWKLCKTQDLRVADQQQLNAKMEGLLEKMITVFSEMKSSLEQLTKAEAEGQKVLQALKTAVDEVIKEAVRSRRPGGLR
jgi:hypothetical protein